MSWLNLKMKYYFVGDVFWIIDMNPRSCLNGPPVLSRTIDRPRWPLMLLCSSVGWLNRLGSFLHALGNKPTPTSLPKRYPATILLTILYRDTHTSRLRGRGISLLLFMVACHLFCLFVFFLNCFLPCFMYDSVCAGLSSSLLSRWFGLWSRISIKNQLFSFTFLRKF